MSNRKTKRFIWVRIIVFLILTGFVLSGLTKIFIPKYSYMNEWSTTVTYKKFYEIEKNTTDVLFLGSSRTMCSFLPQELYNKYGITSYNLGGEQQSIFVSYYWLKEALRFQTPKAVVIEVKELFFHKEGGLNMEESHLRKSMDYMKWSSVKKEAVDDICDLDESQDKVSYYFPIFRFHARWKELEEDDFSYDADDHDGFLKGYNVLSDRYGREYTPLEETGGSEEEMVESMVDYMDRIVELCRQNHIQLILVNTPYARRTVENYNSVAAYAQKHQLPYYDFNLKKYYEEAGYDFASDNADSPHANIWGAIKITDYLGRVLTEQYGIEPRKDAQWEETAVKFEQAKKDCELTKITDLSEYLSMLEDDRYSILVAVKGEATKALTGEILMFFREKGLAIPLENNENISYYAVIDGENVREEAGWESLSADGALRNGRVRYEITSEGKGSGDSCTINIDGEQYAPGKNGLNFVVYNNETRKVIDSVCFDTGGPEWKATR
ncbi:MAG: hypothetical protein HFG80_08155 [Eubacterium sp.]|nr:hypothetical protein [Eubacterium sp.]